MGVGGLCEGSTLNGITGKHCGICKSNMAPGDAAEASSVRPTGADAAPLESDVDSIKATPQADASGWSHDVSAGGSVVEARGSFVYNPRAPSFVPRRVAGAPQARVASGVTITPTGGLRAAPTVPHGAAKTAHAGDAGPEEPTETELDGRWAEMEAARQALAEIGRASCRERV